MCGQHVVSCPSWRRELPRKHRPLRGIRVPRLSVRRENPLGAESLAFEPRQPSLARRAHARFPRMTDILESFSDSGRVGPLCRWVIESKVEMISLLALAVATYRCNSACPQANSQCLQLVGCRRLAYPLLNQPSSTCRPSSTFSSVSTFWWDIYNCGGRARISICDEQGDNAARKAARHSQEDSMVSKSSRFSFSSVPSFPRP